MITNSKKPTKRPIWAYPWGYAEGWVVALGILFTGLALQLSIGGLDPETLAWPVNSIVGGGFTLTLVLAYRFGSRSEIVRWLMRVPAAIVSIALITFLVLLMGFTLQGAEGNPGWVNALGLSHMTRSWPFLFGVMFFLASLGMVTLKRLSPLRGRNIGFSLNHAGLYIALLAGMLGTADLQRLTMDLREGEVAWVGVDQRGRVLEMPLAVELQRFHMDEFNPKITVIESATGKMIEGGLHQMFEIQPGTRGTVGNVAIEVLEYMPLAVVFGGRYEPVNDYGAAPAAFVRASTPDGTRMEGWISSGSFMYSHHTLPLDTTYAVAMTIPRASSYSSDVVVYTRDGNVFETRIEVNKPISAAGWKLYQYSYDERFGRYSELSVIELIRDPWLPVVYLGIFMLLAGSVYLMFLGKAPDSDEVISGESTPDAFPITPEEIRT